MTAIEVPPKDIAEINIILKTAHNKLANEAWFKNR